MGCIFPARCKSSDNVLIKKISELHLLNKKGYRGSIKIFEVEKKFIQIMKTIIIYMKSQNHLSIDIFQDFSSVLDDFSLIFPGLATKYERLSNTTKSYMKSKVTFFWVPPNDNSIISENCKSNKVIPFTSPEQSFSPYPKLNEQQLISIENKLNSKKKSFRSLITKSSFSMSQTQTNFTLTTKSKSNV